jgi:hypothetical protein
VIPQELRQIVDALFDKARNDQVNWIAAADLDMGGETDDVVVSFPDYAINIFAGADEYDRPYITFNIVNSKGKRIHGISLGPSDPDYHLLRELLDIATRKLSGVDHILAELQRRLEQRGVIGTQGPD